MPPKETATMPNPPQQENPPSSILLPWCELVDSLRSDMKYAEKEQLTPGLPDSETSMKLIDDNVKAQEGKIDAMVESNPPESWESVKWRNIELAYRLSSILGMEIIENLRNLWASSYLNLVTSQKYPDDELRSFEEKMNENRRNYTHSLIEEAQETANECEAKGQILDFESWLNLKTVYFEYATQRLEDLRDKILKTYWKAENDEEKKSMLEKYCADIGELLFHEVGRENRSELTQLLETERSNRTMDVRIPTKIYNMRKQIDESVLESDSFFPEDFFAYCFSFANL